METTANTNEGKEKLQKRGAEALPAPEAEVDTNAAEGNVSDSRDIEQSDTPEPNPGNGKAKRKDGEQKPVSPTAPLLTPARQAQNASLKDLQSVIDQCHADVLNDGELDTQLKQNQQRHLRKTIIKALNDDLGSFKLTRRGIELLLPMPEEESEYERNEETTPAATSDPEDKR